MLYRILHVTIADYWWVDAVRVLVVIGAGCMLGFTVHWLQTCKQLVQQLRAAWWITWCLLAVLSELEQIGRRAVVWRLPLFVIGTGLALAQFYMMGGEQ